MRMRQEVLIAVVVMWLLINLGSAHAGGFIVPVSKDSPHQDSRELYAHAKERYPRFLSNDKEKEMLYKITDPKGAVKPFLLSDQSAQKMTHEDATQYCDGAMLAKEAHLLALNRAIQPFPDYKFIKNAIAHIENTTFFGDVTSYAYPQNVFHFTVFDAYDGNVLSYVSFFTFVGNHKAYARCVLPLP